MYTRAAGILVLVVMLAFVSAVSAKTLDQYVEKAKGLREGGALDEAAATMKQAIAEYPDSAIAHAYLGLYRGMQAGDTDNFMQAGQFSQESFELLDRAVELDPKCHSALYNIAVAFADAGLFREAVNWWKRVEEVAPG